MRTPVAQLLEALKTSPGSRELRELLADAWEEEGDPRGGWLRHGLGGEPHPDALADLRAHAPGAQARFDGGLLVELQPEEPVDPAWLASHPLLTLVVALPWKDEELEPALRRWTPALDAVRSVRLTGSLGERCARVLGWLWSFELEALWLSISANATLTRPIGFPTVRALSIEGGEPLLSTLLQGFPAIEHLRLRRIEALPGVLALPTLRCLDVRSLDLPLSTRQALAEAPFEVVHERLALHPSDHDPFGFTGWMDTPATAARALPSSPGFGIVRDGTLYTYQDDEPVSRGPFNGEVPDPPRHCGGVLASAREDAVVWGEERWALGERVRGLVASPSHLWAIAGRQVWQLRPRLLVVGTCEHPTPRISARGATVAWTPSPSSVEVFQDPGDHTFASYPGSYQGSDDPVLVADLLVLQGRVLAVLEHGGANLLQLGSGEALKVDAFPGERDRRWVFVWAGRILIAE